MGENYSFNNEALGGPPNQLFVGRIGPRPFMTGSPEQLQLKTPVVFSSSMDGIANIMSDPTGYSGHALMSMDGLLRPVSISGMEGLPRFARSTKEAVSSFPRLANSIPAAAMFPIYRGITGNVLNYNVPIEKNYLNPLTNPTGYGLRFSQRHEITGSGGRGHDIELVGHPLTGTDVGYSMVTSLGNGSGQESYSNDYKLMALRGPMVVQGWGYDTDGKPIPNHTDTYDNAIQGIYTRTSLKDYFLPDFLQKSETWPVGPVDLRWDRRRSCWVSPQPPGIFRGRVNTNIYPNSTGRVTLASYNENLIGASNEVFYDSLGNSIPIADQFNVGIIDSTGTRAEIIGKNNSSYTTIWSGAYVNIYFNSRNNTHYLMPLDENLVTLGKFIGTGIDGTFSSNSRGDIYQSDRISDSLLSEINNNNKVTVKTRFIDYYPMVSGHKFTSRSIINNSTAEQRVEIINSQSFPKFLYFSLESGRPLIQNSIGAASVYEFLGTSIPANNTNVNYKIVPSVETSIEAGFDGFITGVVGSQSSNYDYRGLAIYGGTSSLGGDDWSLAGTGTLSYYAIPTYLNFYGNLTTFALNNNKASVSAVKINSPLTGVVGNAFDLTNQTLSLSLKVPIIGDVGGIYEDNLLNQYGLIFGSGILVENTGGASNIRTDFKTSAAGFSDVNTIKLNISGGLSSSSPGNGLINIGLAQTLAGATGIQVKTNGTGINPYYNLNINTYGQITNIQLVDL